MIKQLEQLSVNGVKVLLLQGNPIENCLMQKELALNQCILDLMPKCVSDFKNVPLNNFQRKHLVVSDAFLGTYKDDVTDSFRGKFGHSPHLKQIRLQIG